MKSWPKSPFPWPPGSLPWRGRPRAGQRRPGTAGRLLPGPEKRRNDDGMHQKWLSSLTKIGDLSNKLVIYPRKLVIYPRKLVIDPTKLVIWSKNGGVMRVLSGFFMEFWMDTFRYSWLGNPRTKWKFLVDFGFSIAWFFHQKNWDINTIL